MRALLRPLWLLVGAVVPLAGCGDIVWLQAQAETVCQQLSAQRFEISPALRGQVLAAYGDQVALTRAMSIDVREGLPPELRAAADAQLRLASLSVTAAAPTLDLGFIEEARVTLVAPTDQPLETREFVYTRTDAAPTRVDWRGEPVDLAAWLASGRLRFELAFIGRVPDEDAVVVDVELCAAASLALGLP